MSSDSPVIGVIGIPRLWREMLIAVLETAFGAESISEATEPGPIACSCPGQRLWLVVFTQSSTDFALLKKQYHPHVNRVNLLLIARSGEALVRQTNHTEMNLPRISLDQVQEILRGRLTTKTPGGSVHSPD